MRINHNKAFGHAVEQGFEFFLLVLELLKVLALRGEESGELVLDGAQEVIFSDRKSGEGGLVGSTRQKRTERAQTPSELCSLTQCSTEGGKATDKGSVPDPLRPCVCGKEQKEMEQEQGQQGEAERKQSGKGNIISHTNGRYRIR